jgi:hypothetical protein
MFLSSIFLSAFRINSSTIPRRISNPSYGQVLELFFGWFLAISLSVMFVHFSTTRQDINGTLISANLR